MKLPKGKVNVLNNKCKMVSLDTSSTKTGYAIYINGKLDKSGTYDLSKMKENRFENMCISLSNFIKKQEPEIVVVETTAVTRNAQVQRMLTEIIGVCRGCALTMGAEFVELRPTQWRKAVCNKDEKPPKVREELKKWSYDKVKEAYGVTPHTDDESDAILIGQALINLRNE